MNEQIVLEVENVSVVADGHALISDISFTLHRGDILAIVGPNGAGKTTLMRALLGLRESVGAISWASGVRIGYVPQKFVFDASVPLAVGELFQLKSKSFWFSKLKHNEWFKTIGVLELLNKRLSELSGGELQRTLIAYALIDNPDVLFLDEPSAGIDIGGGETIYGLLHDLKTKYGRTIVLISHDLDVVYRYATQVLCIDTRLICRGSPSSALTSATIQEMYGTHAGLYAHHDHA